MTRRIPQLLLLAALAACGPTTAQTAPGPRTFTPPSTTAEPVVAPSVPVLEGLPQAVRIGLTVYVSGMVPVDSAGRLVGPGDLAAQTRQAQVGNDHVIRILPKHRNCRFAICRFINFKAGIFKRSANNFPHVILVIYDKNSNVLSRFH